MKTRIGQREVTCNACREVDALGYEIQLGDPTIHNTMSVSLCRQCYAEVGIVATIQEREACAKIAEDDAKVNASQRDHNPEQFDYWDGADDAAMDIRDAIRARDAK